MNKIKSIAMTLFILSLSACTSIPQESVDLSSEVGIGLKKQHQLQVELVNLYFDSREKELDETMVKELEKYFDTLAPTGELKLNRAQFMDMLADTKDFNAKYNSTKQELEKARMLLIKNLEENYLALDQANSSITELLQASAAPKDMGARMTPPSSEATTGEINLEKTLAEISRFTLEESEVFEESAVEADLPKEELGENQDKEDEM